jgi:hypothetical protein
LYYATDLLTALVLSVVSGRIWLDIATAGSGIAFSASGIGSSPVTLLPLPFGEGYMVLIETILATEAFSTSLQHGYNLRHAVFPMPQHILRPLRIIIVVGLFVLPVIFGECIQRQRPLPYDTLPCQAKPIYFVIDIYI